MDDVNVQDSFYPGRDPAAVHFTPGQLFTRTGISVDKHEAAVAGLHTAVESCAALRLPSPHQRALVSLFQGIDWGENDLVGVLQQVCRLVEVDQDGDIFGLWFYEAAPTLSRGKGVDEAYLILLEMLAPFMDKDSLIYLGLDTRIDRIVISAGKVIYQYAHRIDFSAVTG